MINITFKPKTLELEVTGHAGWANKGEDIVCAAVSALFYTLAEALCESEELLNDIPVIKEEDGNGYISCSPKEEYEGNITRTYWTILVGLQMVAEQYSEYVNFVVEDKKIEG